MGLKELRKKVESYKKKREKTLLKQIAKNKVLISRKISIEKKNVELANQRVELQKLRQKSRQGSFFAGTGKSFNKFRQFATDMTQQPKKGKKKKSMFDF